jgi:hypothetical protein
MPFFRPRSDFIETVLEIRLFGWRETVAQTWNVPMTFIKLSLHVTLRNGSSVVLTPGMPHLHSIFSVKYSQVPPPHTTELASLGVHQPTMFADTPASLQILNLLDPSSGNK